MAKDTRPGGNVQQPQAFPHKQTMKPKAQKVTSVGNGKRVAGELKNNVR